MNENIKKFLAKVEQSPELQAQFAQIRDPEEAYKLASSVQGGFTKEEFVSEMTKLYEVQIADLSEDDVAKIAGGLDDAQKSLIATTSTMGTIVISLAAGAV